MSEATIEELIWESMDLGANGVAKVAHHMYKERYACVMKARKPFWYERKGDGWVEMQHGWLLRRALSGTVASHYERTALNAYRQAGQEEDVTFARKIRMEGEKLISVYVKLQTVRYVDRVMKECAMLFRTEGIVGEKRNKVELTPEGAWILDTYHHVVGMLRGR